MNNSPTSLQALRRVSLLCCVVNLMACDGSQALKTELDHLDREISSLRLEISRMQHRRELALNEIAGYPKETRREESMQKLDQERQEAEGRLRQRESEYDRLHTQLKTAESRLKIYTQTYVKP